MATRTDRSTRGTHFTRRTQIVWGCFIVAMTLVVGLLALGDDDLPGGYLAANLSPIADPSFAAGADRDPLFADLEVPLDRQRWTGIVIHHLGAPAGDAESIHRQHLGYGYQGLGYQFLIGNGNGLGDGVVHVGYRWSRQLPGAHCVGEWGDHHNQHSIGICLIGNGDRRPFTEQQVQTLVTLIQRLQRELQIPRERVVLHRQMASVSSPGQWFPTSRVAEQLLD